MFALGNSCCLPAGIATLRLPNHSVVKPRINQHTVHICGDQKSKNNLGVSVREELTTDLDHLVKGNDWRVLEPAKIGEGTPSLSVTVVIPCYMGQTQLTLTLAGLAYQTYPSHLIEVLVVDDGSQPPIHIPSGVSLNASVVSQERDGFGLARARNLGARQAEGELLIFLDCDMIPESQFVEAHARWHQAYDRALTMGFRGTPISKAFP